MVSNSSLRGANQSRRLFFSSGGRRSALPGKSRKSVCHGGTILPACDLSRASTMYTALHTTPCTTCTTCIACPWVECRRNPVILLQLQLAQGRFPRLPNETLITRRSEVRILPPLRRCVSDFCWRADRPEWERFLLIVYR